MMNSTDVKAYKIPKNIDIKISPFFRDFPCSSWSIRDFCRYKQALNPSSNYAAVEKAFKEDINKIKNCDEIPREIRSISGCLLQDKKGKKRETPTTGNIIINNTNCNTVNNNISMPAPEIDNDELVYNTDTKNDLSYLFPYLFSLYNKKPVNIPNQTPNEDDASLLSLLNKGCLNKLNNFNNLTKEERSFLHVLLSGCINTIIVSYRPTLTSIIGEYNLERIIKTLNDTNSYNNFTNNFTNNFYTNFKNELMKEYNKKGIPGLRIFISREKLKVYEVNYNNNSDNKLSNDLKFLDLFEYILNNVEYKDWDSKNLNEESYGYYWKEFFSIMFRGTDYILKGGESSCIASKCERQLNEFEYGLSDNNIIGRKMDLITCISFLDEKRKEIDIELGSIEIKPEGVSEEVEMTQLNKNIRSNKCILHIILLYLDNDEDFFNLFTIGLDIVGLNGFFYKVCPYEDVVATIKLAKHDLFLPTNDIEFKYFLESDTVEQFLYYIDHLNTLKNLIQYGFIKHKRARFASRSSNNISPRSISPTRVPMSFPQGTFFTPKRN